MKKLTSLLLSIALLISMVSSSASAFAKSQKGPQYKSEIINLKSLDPDTISDKSNSSDIVYANSFLSSGPSEPYRFYSVLDENQRSVYDAIHNSIIAGNFKEEYTVNFANKIRFDGTIDQNDYLVITEETKEVLSRLFFGAISSLIDDYPMMFWTSRVGYSFLEIKGEMGDNGIYHAVVDQATITFPLDKTAFNDYNQVKSKYNALQNAVNTFTVNGTTRYEKVKSIHDSIAKLAAYDNNFSPESYSPTSAILSPYLTVCEGYAESFKLICDREGIPCIIVVGVANGGAHAWNYVKMEDNKWYGLDLTWDDQVSKLYYDFFLVGANTVAPNFNGAQTFSQSHTPLGNRFPSSFRLTYPMLADNAYEVPKIELVPPQNLVAKSVTQDTISVSWDMVANATGYNIYVNGALNNTQPIADTSYAVANLSANTQYEITVKSAIGDVESATGTSITVKTNEAAQTPIPTPPTAVNSGTVTENSINISWTVSDNATGYNVYVNGALNNTQPIADTSYAVANLSANTQYEITVKSVIGDVESATGTSITVTTKASEKPDPIVPTERMLGDVTGDGRVTSGDAIAVLRAEAQLRTLTAEEFTAADVVKDNRVTSGDAIRILRYEAQLVPSL